MEAKDGSMSFDFIGVYSKVEPHRQIEYMLEDGRTVQIYFAAEGDKITVTENFQAEQMHPIAMQQTGWQAILDNFKKYVEASGPRHSTNTNGEKSMISCRTGLA